MEFEFQWCCKSFNGYHRTNYQMTAHIYSLVPWNARAVDPVSLGTSRGRYIDNNYSLYYNGYAVVTSPFVRPNVIYLAPVPSNPTNQEHYVQFEVPLYISNIIMCSAILRLICFSLVYSFINERLDSVVLSLF